MTPADLIPFYFAFYVITRGYLVMVYAFGALLVVIGLLLMCTGSPSDDQIDKVGKSVGEAVLAVVFGIPIFVPVFGDLYWLARRATRVNK